MNINDQITSLVRDGELNTDDISDGYHTFGELYRHRTVLFAALCAAHSNAAWRALRHADGTMYDGMFIVGIHTAVGDITYHCEMEYWDMFAKVTTLLEHAPAYDGHTPNDVIDRIIAAYISSEI